MQSESGEVEPLYITDKAHWPPRPEDDTELSEVASEPREHSNIFRDQQEVMSGLEEL